MLSQTPLFEVLATRCEQGNAAPLNGRQLLATIEKGAHAMGQLLNRACTNFPDYTLHDEEHAVRVVRLMYRVMGDGLVQHLNVVELALLILAAFGHDTGMAIGRERREQLMESDDYRQFLQMNESKWREVEQAKEAGDTERFQVLTDLLFQDFLRRRHHILSAELMEQDFRDYLLVEEKSLVSPVAKLCRSHGESVGWVSKLDQFPFAGEFRADLPFLACVLRLADFLDLDASRAPASLLERVIRPRSDVSWREWRKHQASNFLVTETSINFQGEFEDFFDEKALRDTLDGIEQERRECMEFLHGRPDPSAHRLRLDKPVERAIVSKGYIYEEFRFQLEYKEILSLLMGARLYKDERVFVRELVQNALDACRHAEAAALKLGRGDYKGKITIRRFREEGSSQREVLEVSDNGSGMTRAIVRDYFMRVGRSYYHSFAFRRKDLSFHPVSQFGIGILSCFMKADYLDVETRPDPATHEDLEAGEPRALKLEIRGPHEFFVVRECQRRSPGTTVRVFLKAPLVESLATLVERFVGRVPYSVEVQDLGKPLIVIPKRPFDFTDQRFHGLFTEIPGAFGYVSKELVFEGKLGFELAGCMRFFLLDSNNRRHLHIRNAGKYTRVSFGPEGDTLLVATQLTQEVRNKMSAPLRSIYDTLASFDSEDRTDIETIVRDFGRLCDLLVHQHETEEVEHRWTALSAHIEALIRSPSFCANPACVRVQEYLNRARGELEAFVSGRFRIHSPLGMLTQDGLNLTMLVNLPLRLRLGIGYMYNLDLSGQYRLSLNVARDDVLFDTKYDALVSHLHGEIGRFLGKWFREEHVAAGEVRDYLKQVPRPLGSAVESTFK